MRKLSTYAFAAIVAIVAVAPVQAADHPQKPGKWSVKFQMEMPGMPFKMPPVTTEICLTEEDLKDPQKSVPQDAKQQCKVGDYKIEGNKVSWTIDCPKQNTKGTGEITYSEDSYTGSMKMTVGEQEMTTKYSGKWVGECKK
jgi:Protein of unknown function (DUF3617)